jgi:hypothetical protein
MCGREQVKVKPEIWPFFVQVPMLELHGNHFFLCYCRMRYECHRPWNDEDQCHATDFRGFCGMKNSETVGFRECYS